MSRSKSFERGVRRQGITIMKTVVPKEEIKRIRAERTAERWKIAQADLEAKAAAKAAEMAASASDSGEIGEEELAMVQDLGTPRVGEVAEVVNAIMAQDQ